MTGKKSPNRTFKTLSQGFGAKLVSLASLKKLRPTLGKLVITGGGFDPIHPGHISCIIASKKHGDTLVVVVNGDAFLTAKKGHPFQNLQTRCLIVSAIRGVDYVVPFEVKDDQTITKAIEEIKPDVYTKGGDRKDKDTIPEWDVCKKYGVKIVTGVGVDKMWSSSQFLQEWEERPR